MNETDREFHERERIRAEGMSDYIVKYGVVRFGLPLLALSIALLAYEGRLFERITAETFVVRILGPVVGGLMIARLGWARIVQARLAEHERQQREEPSGE